ncbi:heavy metal translocating P-type ATPase [Pseudoxanthomonas suwonensis 11-1]|uniref:Heavy metal translocating P-type ATPase n=1 Tax=Pseudoxanthomonas suwonensis (strain 11-1) TaxID=743721 RepID=E6WPF3_PSEUU|nr:heavy metal translocating P-type ATPase [Pseudoxanthomonas suwonensis]ADV26197.1 heavy metal translocating P-type ATPase [Pseudoxanthomonas suwonensis 11-1]
MAAALAMPATAFAAGHCHHCGEALPANARVVELDGQARSFCCQGCAAAAEWIAQADLDGYYRLRSAAAGKVGEELPDLAVWDRADVQAEHSRAIEGGREITLLTDGMRCAACAWLIDRALAREPGVVDCSANAVTGRIRITWDPSRTALSVPLRRLAMLGYRPYLAGSEALERERTRERRRWLLRLGIAGLGMFQAMMMAEALYLDFDSTMPEATRDFFRWLTFLLCAPVVFYSGWPFLAGAARELRERRLGMDFLIASSTLLAYFASLVETIRGGPHVWYDAAVMFVFLLLAARMLEQRARSVASAQVDALARARPAFATRELGDGRRETVPLSLLAPGDVACVAAGEAVPADGVLLGDEAWFEEALLTGESAPVRHVPGDTVYAGTVCRERPARLRVTCTGTATRLSQLARLVEQAQAHRPALARLADRVGSRFVMTLLPVAALVFAGWWHWQPGRALEVTLALLVISCPCALSLAVPTALAAAHGALARTGLLAMRPDAVDTLARATDMVFDKTGTLSDGRPVLASVEVLAAGLERDEVLAIAAALERDTGHPLAAAFAAAASSLVAGSVEAVPGRGVQGVVGGRSWHLGRADFAAGREDDGALWLGDGVVAAARFVLEERARPDAAQALAALRAQGLRLHLASGDGEAAVARLAVGLGLDQRHARQSPEDKLALVRRLQADGRIVAMIGDGLNDAPVLAGADVSIAMGQGASLAHRAADLVTTGEGLLRIPAAVAVARRTRAIVRQNLAWAAAYNVLAIPLAAAGLVTPWIAALGMALSSLLVTLNALRLARQAPLPASGDNAGSPMSGEARA